MKYVSVLLAVLLVTACNQQKVNKLESELQKIKKQNELIRNQSRQKDTFIEDYTNTLNDVYDNLEIIRKREGLITAYSKNIENKQKAGIREKMLTDIRTLDNYITRSKAKLLRLQNRFRSISVDSKGFEKTIEKLNRELEAREKYIRELRVQISSLNEQVTSAAAELQVKNELIEAQSERINRVFYIIGDEDTLAAQKVIAFRGGILGFGQTVVMNPRLNRTAFTPVDMTEMDSIAIHAPAKAIRLISGNDPQSYEMLADSSNGETILHIVDPDAFWHNRYLVIMAPKSR